MCTENLYLLPFFLTLLNYFLLALSHWYWATYKHASQTKNKDQFQVGDPMDAKDLDDRITEANSYKVWPYPCGFCMHGSLLAPMTFLQSIWCYLLVAGFKLSPSEGVASRVLGLRRQTETKAIDVDKWMFIVLDQGMAQKTLIHKSTWFVVKEGSSTKNEHNMMQWWMTPEHEILN